MSKAPQTVPVSVIIPCYNSERTIRNALLSVVQQSQRPLEIICVDDCSKDRTIDVIRVFAEEFSEQSIRIERMPGNDGPGSARNLGWDMAKGDYVAFLDSDDFWHPQKLEFQLAVMREHGCFGSSHRRTPDLPGLFDETQAKAQEISISTGELLFRNRIVTSAVMLKNQPGFRFRSGMRYCEDLQLWFEILFAGNSFVYLDLPLSSLSGPEEAPNSLSSAVVKMEKSKQGIFRELRRKRRISVPQLFAASGFSLMKFVFRRMQGALSIKAY
ncbi:glycosyltransferase family 2 protein [Roseibium sp. SCP14]|uniref:glycosyltransferase family 2 protein n=1 Tax=Roseibium sp. SCP14 TaxID=3141375 RepID=UPI00333954E3